MPDTQDANDDGDDWEDFEPTREPTQGTERQGDETLPNEDEPGSGGGSSGYSSWSSFGQPVPFSSGSGPIVDRSDAPSDIDGSSILDAEDFVEGYVLREKLGQGAQGQVWRAFSRKYGRDVALKFAEARGSNRGLWQRMREEARVLLDLTHGSIVRLYDIAVIDKHLFLVTELIEGPTLHDILVARRRKPFEGENGFTTEECVWLVEQLVGAFELATEAGIVHRDVKPSNIMLDREVDATKSLTESGAQVKLCDFGVAYVDRGDGDDAKVSPTGTKPFIAPEIEARRKPTLQADIYSLAATLVTLVTGLSRKKDENFALMREAIKRARTIGLGTASATFDAAIKKGLSPDPADRFGDVDEFLYELSGRTKGKRVAPRTGPWKLAVGILAVVASVAAFLVVDPMGLRSGELVLLSPVEGAGGSAGERVVLTKRTFDVEFTYRSPGDEAISVEWNSQRERVRPLDSGGDFYSLRLEFDEDGDSDVRFLGEDGATLGLLAVTVDTQVELDPDRSGATVAGPVCLEESVPFRIVECHESVEAFEVVGGERVPVELVRAGDDLEGVLAARADLELLGGVAEGEFTRTLELVDRNGNLRTLGIRIDAFDERVGYQELAAGIRSAGVLAPHAWDLPAHDAVMTQLRERLSSCSWWSESPRSGEIEQMMRDVEARWDEVRGIPTSVKVVGAVDDAGYHRSEAAEIAAHYFTRRNASLRFEISGSRSAGVEVVPEPGSGIAVVGDPSVDRSGKGTLNLLLDESARGTLRLSPEAGGALLEFVVVRDVQAPTLNIPDDLDGRVTNQSEVTALIEVADLGSGLASVELFADGQVIWSVGSIQNGELEVPLPLPMDGTHRFSAIARDRLGWASEPVAFALERDTAGPSVVDSDASASPVETGRPVRFQWTFDEPIELPASPDVWFSGGAGGRVPASSIETWELDGSKTVVTLVVDVPFDGGLVELGVDFTVADARGVSHTVSKVDALDHDPWGATPSHIRQNATAVLDPETLVEVFGSEVDPYVVLPLSPDAGSLTAPLRYPRCIRYGREPSDSGLTFVFARPGQFRYGPQHAPDSIEVSMSGFYISATEVSVDQYGAVQVNDRFVDDSKPGEFPATTMWPEARDWCGRLGLSLPSEAEWEYAASGPMNNEFPWGPALDRDLASVAPADGLQGPAGQFVAVDAYPGGASWCGARNMVGNAFEWCLDVLSPEALRSMAEEAKPDLPRDPIGDLSGAEFMHRGGGKRTRKRTSLTTFYRAAPIPSDLKGSPKVVGIRPVWRLDP